jgi:hypothetical protein
MCYTQENSREKTEKTRATTLGGVVVPPFVPPNERAAENACNDANSAQYQTKEKRADYLWK